MLRAGTASVMTVVAVIALALLPDVRVGQSTGTAVRPSVVPVDPLSTTPVTARTVPPYVTYATHPYSLPEPVPGDCESYRVHMDVAGLPADVFLPIAQRETGCNHLLRVVDHDDVSGGLLQFNFHANTGSYWTDLCGLTWANVTANLSLQLECAWRGYADLGVQPWEGSE